ncbi:MAG: hypothetical protein ACJ8FY_20160 [Gemmataceae bacterium]
MTKPSSRMASPPDQGKGPINSNTDETSDLGDSVLVTTPEENSWPYRLAMLAILGAILLLSAIVLFDFFMGLMRGAPGPGGGRI